MREAVNNGTAKVLTLQAAKELKGKKISTIYFGYRGQDGVEEFIVGDIISQWDLAAKNVDEKNFPEGNQQLHWASFMRPERINESKKTLELLDINGKEFFIRCNLNSIYFKEETFTCSDADREVFYVEITDYLENVQTGKRYYDLKHSYDAKLNLETGEVIRNFQNEYFSGNFFTINQLISQGLLIDKQWHGGELK